MNDFPPDGEDLRRVTDTSAADRERVDALLATRGEPPVDTSAKPVRRLDVDRDALDSALFQMVADQAREIRELRTELSDLQKRMASVEGLVKKNGGEPGAEAVEA